MERKDFLRSTALGSLALGTGGFPLAAQPRAKSQEDGARKILIMGGGYGTTVIRYMAQLTGKERPRICYLPTAAADSTSSMLRWYQSCAPLNAEPHVQ